MATPPEQTSRPASYGYNAGTTLDFARLPIPGNAEFLVYVVVMIILSIAALVEDQYNIPDWSIAVTFITSAYLISRGIAKASRVLEQ